MAALCSMNIYEIFCTKMIQKSQFAALFLVLAASARLSSAAPPTSFKHVTNLLAPAIDEESICCNGTAKSYLKTFTSLDACNEFCGERSLSSLQMGGNRYTCQRPGMSCDRLGEGADCADCFVQGTCYLVLNNGEVSVNKSTSLSKLTREIGSAKQTKFEEQQESERSNGLNGVGTLTLNTTGSKAEQITGSDKVLKSQTTEHIVTNNFQPQEKGLNLPGGLNLQDVKGVGASGSSIEKNSLELATYDRTKDTGSNIDTTQSETFNQNLADLVAGQYGTFNSSKDSKLSEKELGREKTSTMLRTKAKEIELRGTAAGDLDYINKLNKLEQKVTKTESAKKKEKLGESVTNQQLKKQNGDKVTEEILTGSEKIKETSLSSKSNVTKGTKETTQVASNKGMNMTVEEQEVSHATELAGVAKDKQYNTSQLTNNECVNCESKMKVDTTGQEGLRSQESKNTITTKQGVTNLSVNENGESVRTESAKVESNYERQKNEVKSAEQQQKYSGARSQVSLHGDYTGTVQGQTNTVERSHVSEKEEGFSASDFNKLNQHAFPTISDEAY